LQVQESQLWWISGFAPQLTSCAGITPIWHYFGRQPVDDHLHALQRVLPLDRVHIACEDGDTVGAAGSFPFELTVPGGRVSAAGVTIVAVLPTHRRRGILRRLMRARLASLSADIDLQRDRARFYNAAKRPVRTTLLPLKDAKARIAPIYEHVAQATPGMFARSPDWWEARTLADPPWRRGNAGELQCAVLELDSGAAAYALYRN
jgi:predicted acetyltransferase